MVSLWLRFATQARIAEIKEAVNNEMKARIEAATVTFKDIVQSPSAIIMEGKIAGLSRQGKVKPDDGKAAAMGYDHKGGKGGVHFVSWDEAFKGKGPHDKGKKFRQDLEWGKYRGKGDKNKRNR